MPFKINNPEKAVRYAVIATLAFMVCWELVVVCVPIRPFWVDEWRIIYNIKFKSAKGIWGQLYYMQQFPRIYLAIVKAFTSAFHYSYTALRLPSFLVGTATILFCYKLMKRLYPEPKYNRYLFVMILISSYTFTEYFVQIKQYTMEILLSLVGIWQLAELIGLRSKPSVNIARYTLLCLSFLVVPFFSYTYPIVIVPVYIILFLESILLLKDDVFINKRRVLSLQWFPLLICLAGNFVFYKIDISQVLKDQGMRQFWSYLIMPHGFDIVFFFTKFYHLFAQVGSGFVFEILFGVTGLAAFLYGMYKVAPLIFRRKNIDEIIRLYSVLLIVVTLVLFSIGKLPLGEPRLNSFTVPAISILIIYLLDSLSASSRGRVAAGGIAALFYLGLIGNIYTSCANYFTDPKYAKKMRIYKATQAAIKIAQAKQVPVLITPGVVYPHNGTRNLPFKTLMPGDWVFKSFPAYDVSKAIRVYPIEDTTNIANYIAHLPAADTEVMAGNGESFKIIRR